VDGLISAVLDNLGDNPSLASQARCAGLIGAIVSDLQLFGYKPSDPRYERTLHAVLDIFDAKASSIDFQLRLEAADSLGQAGDPRLRQDNWVTIDGATAGLKPFQIWRYTTTVEEYSRFISDEGYQNQRWWSSGGFGEGREPEEWDEQLRHPNWPVTYVSWYDAAAYCEWAVVRLPTDKEWELAACGQENRKHPWGSQEPEKSLANFDGTVGHPTPVGLYPAGSTPDGIADMAGNVWEWLQDLDPLTGMRALRGGSFMGAAKHKRPSGHGVIKPRDRFRNIGFRCVRDVP
jgi:hypothetical protein